MLHCNILEWSTKDVEYWMRKEDFDEESIKILCKENKVNGKCLLALNDNDFVLEPIIRLNLRDRKSLYVAVKSLQKENHNVLIMLGLVELSNLNTFSSQNHHHLLSKHESSDYYEPDRITPPISDEIRIQRLPPEIWKAFLAFCYVVLVTWITSFVMVIVHDRVPDMKKYPPLPDIFLDNVPHIPWAFDMCEITGTIMFSVWLIVLFFHKHRFILMRRFFALSGTVFLLRCVTMLITSLSVPGTHLQCQPRVFSSLDEDASFFDDLKIKIGQAYVIWRGAGMSIQGVRTCGDYMFSGHTVALTMLNFFITEYTPQRLYFLHTMTWIMNMFGIFFILAAHEHYSIDVFVAFYITSRLFCYYHTLSNNQALMQQDSVRTRIWFPLLSFFESGVDGSVPNEYDTLAEVVMNTYNFFKRRLDAARRYQFRGIRNQLGNRNANGVIECSKPISQTTLLQRPKPALAEAQCSKTK